VDKWLDPARPVPDLRTAVPGPQGRRVLERDAAVTSPSLPRAYPMVPRRGSGAVLEDVDGNRFIDFTGGLGVLNAGHTPPPVVQAVKDQVERYLHTCQHAVMNEPYVAVAEALNQVFPGIGSEVFNEVINQVVANRAALGVFGLLSVAYAGSGFVGSMTACLNRMWKVPAGRNPVGQKVVNILIVMLLGSVLLGSALLTIWVSATAQETLNLGPTSPVISMIEEVAAPASMLIVLLLMYRLLPARPHSWLSQIPGAIFGGVGFYLLKRGFDLWASHSAGIGALPRSLVSVTLLLVWLGFFGQLILYGAALNVVLDRRHRGEPIMPEAPPPAGR